MQLKIVSFLILLQVRSSLFYIFGIYFPRFAKFLRIFSVLFQFFGPSLLKSLVCKYVYLYILITIQGNTNGNSPPNFQQRNYISSIT